MAKYAVVWWRGSLPPRHRPPATVGAVAAHTSLAEIVSGFVAVELNVWVVAGDTSQSSFARGPAAAHPQLLKLIQRNEMSSFDCRTNRKYIHDIAERGTGPKVEIILAGLE